MHRSSWSRPQGTCFLSGKFGRLQKDCPLSKPPPEATGQPTRPANTISTSNNKRGEQLWEELTSLEFEHFTDTSNGVKRISTITSSVGPLYYATVDIEGSLVEALVDPGSAATIMSYDLFQCIGRKAHIPSAVLSKPIVTLQDYSQYTIPICTSVDLTMSFNGKKVVHQCIFVHLTVRLNPAC